jgi:uncharacterized protein involved in exopolysaccharide biosynthesis
VSQIADLAGTELNATTDATSGIQTASARKAALKAAKKKLRRMHLIMSNRQPDFEQLQSELESLTEMLSGLVFFSNHR